MSTEDRNVKLPRSILATLIDAAGDTSNHMGASQENRREKGVQPEPWEVEKLDKYNDAIRTARRVYHGFDEDEQPVELQPPEGMERDGLLRAHDNLIEHEFSRGGDDQTPFIATTHPCFKGRSEVSRTRGSEPEDEFFVDHARKARAELNRVLVRMSTPALRALLECAEEMKEER